MNWTGARRKVVLVTQGTVANYDFRPLDRADAGSACERTDLLRVVTAGGRAIDAIPGPIPATPRWQLICRSNWVLPKVDAFVRRLLWQRQPGR